MKQGRQRNWFNVLTTAWAIALVLVATTWFVAPAFAGGGDDTDCGGACVDVCEECDYGEYGGGYCHIFCLVGEGGSFEVGTCV